MNLTDPTDNAVKPVPPDMLTINVKYAFSLNPDNCHQFTDNSTLMNKLGASVSKRLYYVNRYVSNKIVYPYRELGISFEIYPEIKCPSEKQNKEKTPRIHYHGYVTFTNIQGLSIWYMYVYECIRRVSSICVKEMKTEEDEQNWSNYVFKNKGIMKPICQYQQVKYGIKTHKVKYI